MKNIGLIGIVTVVLGTVGCGVETRGMDAEDGGGVDARVVSDANIPETGRDVQTDVVADGGQALPECDDNTDCSDGNACNGAERCIARHCVPALARPAPCDDEIDCTADSCDPRTGACRARPNHMACAAETPICDPARGCVCSTDATCDDAVACNGREICADGACEPGAAETCNDGDDCTVDRCAERGGGFGCLHPRIADARCAEPACRDGEIRRCTTDCGSDGFRACTDGAFGPCFADEECNGCDDDLDLVADNGFRCVQGSVNPCTTSCGSTGSETCSASCTLEACVAPSEACNSADDDCDGLIDNGFDCTPGETRACASACGSEGTQTCSGSCGWGACAPNPEVCDGRDNNCDGSRDNIFECVRGSVVECITCAGERWANTCRDDCTVDPVCNKPEICQDRIDNDCAGDGDALCPVCGQGETQPCTISTPTCFAFGHQECGADGRFDPTCIPPVERCNAQDDNCDGASDESFACVQGSIRVCATACGSEGLTTCQNDCSDGPCEPPGEICNDMDDDCDGEVDNGFTCRIGSVRSCMSSCGTVGSQACEGTCNWGACRPLAEVCDAIDNDCNGVADDGFGCVQREVRACPTVCGSIGSSTCAADCSGFGACVAPAEVCNGVDDDCDGAPDNGFVCVRGATRVCITACGSPGNQTCDASCGWGACIPDAEVCNSLDDDCDGELDNGFACVARSVSNCPTACGSVGAQSCSDACVPGPCAPPAESCNGDDDDCDGASDEDFACVQFAITPCVTACGSNGSSMCQADCSIGQCVPPPEVCNDLDDDCDGAIDNGCPTPCAPDREELIRSQFEPNGPPVDMGPEWFVTPACYDLDGDGDPTEPGECGVCNGTIDPAGGSVSLTKTSGPNEIPACQLAQVLSTGRVVDLDYYQVCGSVEVDGPPVSRLAIEVLGNAEPWLQEDGVFWFEFGPVLGPLSLCSPVFQAGSVDQNGDGVLDPVPNDEPIRYAFEYGLADPATTVTVTQLSFLHYSGNCP